jgi:hypothetical protein
MTVGAALAVTAGMHRLAVLILVASCAPRDGSARSCPANGNLPVDCREVVDPGVSCPFPAMGTALAGSCYCDTNGFWECNNCPFFWTPFAGCTPGTTCEINSWEHGCECGCNANGEWDCAPDTIGSHCPTSDAGVD